LRHLLYRSLSYIEIGSRSFFILCAIDQQYTQELQYNISKLCEIVENFHSSNTSKFSNK
jgi:hypothetical protein